MQQEQNQNPFGLSESTISHWLPIWIANATLNRELLFTDEGEPRPNILPIEKLPRANLTPAIVLGTGPTLDFTLDSLTRNRDALANFTIFTSISNITALLAKDIIPQYVIAVDSSERLAQYIGNLPLTLLKDTILVAPPTISHTFLKAWPYRVLLFRPNQPGQPFLDSILPNMYSKRWDHGYDEKPHFESLLKVSLLNAGCVINTAVEVADFLCHAPLILGGVDYSMPQGRIRAQLYEYVKPPTPRASKKDALALEVSRALKKPTPGKWVALPEEPRIKPFGFRTDKTGNLMTSEEMLAYKLNLYVVLHMSLAPVWVIHDPTLINHEVEGTPVQDLIYELPHRDIASLLSNPNDSYPWSPDQYKEALESAFYDMGLKAITKPGVFQLLPKSDYEAQLKANDGDIDKALEILKSVITTFESKKEATS